MIHQSSGTVEDHTRSANNPANTSKAAMTKRLTEHASVALINGLYRVVSVSWEANEHGDNYDYYHAAVERDGRWNAEFYDQNGQMIWAYGTEDTTALNWKHDTKLAAQRGWPENGDPSIRVTAIDVDFDNVPPGSLCQTVDERSDGIPRHWKKWRMV